MFDWFWIQKVKARVPSCRASSTEACLIVERPYSGKTFCTWQSRGLCLFREVPIVAIVAATVYSDGIATSCGGLP